MQNLPYPVIHYQQPPIAASGFGWFGNGYGWQLDPGAWQSSVNFSEVSAVHAPPIDDAGKNRKQNELFGVRRSGTLTRNGEVQDFYKIRNECLANGTLFEDSEFHSVESSRESHSTHEWKRPHEISKDPKFFVDGFSRFDAQQGYLGDCWFLIVAASITLHSRLFLQIVPDDQDFDYKYAGIFHFRFWEFGKWIDIVIDDRLPTKNGKLIYSSSTEKNEFWIALLEKAYAKLKGSYEKLNEEEAAHIAMEDLTGGVLEGYEMKSAPPNLFQMILEAYEHSSLITCSTDSGPFNRTGIIGGHGYSITKVKYVEIQTPLVSGKIPLLRLRNPWGNSYEWNGIWSDKTPEWRFIPQEEKEKLGLTFDVDGEFWMSFEDFKKYFNRLDICHLNPKSLSKPELQHSNKKKWDMFQFKGEWVEGVTAGGCRNNLSSFCQNPQYRITLTDVDKEDDKNKCTMIVNLIQKNAQHYIGFAIYHLSHPDKFSKPLDLNFFKHNAPVARSPKYHNMHEISYRFKLPRGTYCIIPTTFSPNKKAKFLLRVLTEKQNVKMDYDYRRNIRGNDMDVEGGRNA